MSSTRTAVDAWPCWFSSPGRTRRCRRASWFSHRPWRICRGAEIYFLICDQIVGPSGVRAARRYPERLRRMARQARRHQRHLVHNVAGLCREPAKSNGGSRGADTGWRPGARSKPGLTGDISECRHSHFGHAVSKPGQPTSVPLGKRAFLSPSPRAAPVRGRPSSCRVGVPAPLPEPPELPRSFPCVPAPKISAAMPQ